jgi:hypothetical protein
MRQIWAFYVILDEIPFGLLVRCRCSARESGTDCVTCFAYRPSSRPQGSLTPTQSGRVTNPTQGHPGPPWEAPQAECRSLRREPKPPA